MSSNYELPYSDPSLKPDPVIVPENTLESSSTSLTFIGKGTLDRGDILQFDLLHLLENFASNSPPDYPTWGQLWYKANDKKVKVYTQTGWVDLQSTAGYTATPPSSPDIGMLWLDSGSGRMRFWNGYFWNPIVTGNVTVSTSVGSPNTPFKGDIWFNEAQNILYVFNGTAWQEVSGSGGSGGGSLDGGDTGSIPFQSDPGVTVFLDIGAQDSFLISNGSEPFWTTTPTFSATATAPFAVASSQVVANLNSDKLDGEHGSYYLDLANHTGVLDPARLPAFGGDVSRDGANLTLSNTGVIAGTYNKVTVDAKGRVTLGENTSDLTVSNLQLEYAAMRSYYVDLNTNNPDQAIFSAPISECRTAKIVAQCFSEGLYQSSEVILVHDDVNASLTEYAIVRTGSIIAYFSSDVVAGQVRLLVNPVNSITKVKVVATTINT